MDSDVGTRRISVSPTGQVGRRDSTDKRRASVGHLVVRQWKILRITLALILWIALPILPLLDHIETAGASTPKIVILNTADNRLDGVLLISGTPSKYVGLAQSRILPALETRLGTPIVEATTICRFKLPVTVAKWGDLSVVFENEKFALLDYNYLGWPVSQRTHPPLPPAGVTLKPLIKTNFGATIGDTAAKLKALDSHVRGEASSVFSVSIFSLLVMTKRAGATGTSASTFRVSQLEVATGNC